jgi:hypothetical protein
VPEARRLGEVQNSTNGFALLIAVLRVSAYHNVVAVTHIKPIAVAE